MALKFFDGFDYYASAQVGLKWSSTSFMAVNTGGRYGGSCAGATNGATACNTMYQLPAPVATLIAGVAVNLSVSCELIRFNDGGSNQVSVYWDSTAKTLAVRRNGTTLATSNSNVLQGGTWNYVELKATINGTTGSYAVRLNSFAVPGLADATNVNTQATGNATANQVSFLNAGAGSIDDCYICDTTGTLNNDFLGDVRCVALLPTGAGNATQWTAVGAATNWQSVNQSTPDDDTTYTSSATVGQVDEFTYASLPAAFANVKAVQHALYARKDDAAGRQVAMMQRSGTTDYQGTTVTMASSYAYYFDLHETDPSTGVAYTPAGVNGAQFGYKEIA